MKANTEERVKAVLDVFKDKLVKRGDLAEGARRRRARSRPARSTGSAPTSRRASRRRTPRRSPRSSATRAQERQGPDPGRRAARQLQEPRRPAGRHRPAQGQGPRLRPAVRQLPLSRPRPPSQAGWYRRPSPRAGRPAPPSAGGSRTAARRRPPRNGLAIISALVVCSAGSGGSGSGAGAELELAQRAGQGQRVAGELGARTRRPGTPGDRLIASWITVAAIGPRIRISSAAERAGPVVVVDRPERDEPGQAGRAT